MDKFNLNGTIHTGAPNKKYDAFCDRVFGKKKKRKVTDKEVLAHMPSFWSGGKPSRKQVDALFKEIKTKLENGEL